MADVLFFEKSGCSGNARQKAALLAAGHRVVARDLRAEAWTAEKLLRFLDARPVADWFNPSAPAVKQGRIVPDALHAEAAMALLLADPLLIRRPLMAVGDTRMVGFDTAAVHAWIGLGETPPAHLDACAHAPGERHTCADPYAAEPSDAAAGEP